MHSRFMLLAWVMLTIDNRSLLTVQNATKVVLNVARASVHICMYMYLKKSFSLHSSGDPPDRDGQA